MLKQKLVEKTIYRLTFFLIRSNETKAKACTLQTKAI